MGLCGYDSAAQNKKKTYLFPVVVWNRTLYSSDFWGLMTLTFDLWPLDIQIASWVTMRNLYTKFKLSMSFLYPFLCPDGTHTDGQWYATLTFDLLTLSPVASCTWYEHSVKVAILLPKAAFTPDIDSMEGEWETAPKLLNDTSFNDLERPLS